MYPFTIPRPIEALNGGLFVSTGVGVHQTRTLDSYELIFVERGRLELFEESNELCLGPGEALVLRPGHRHGGQSPFAKGLRFYWVHFRPVTEAAPERERLQLPQRTALNEPERMIELFRRFIVDQETGRTTSLSSSSLVILMLCELEASAREAVAPEDDGRHILADQVDVFIAENFRRELTSSLLARELGYHPDYLERVFRAVRGRSITEAIHGARIKEARAHLRSGVKMNIDQIAFLCGYRHASYFRKMFKRIAHLTPKEYRRLYRSMHINTH